MAVGSLIGRLVGVTLTVITIGGCGAGPDTIDDAGERRAGLSEASSPFQVGHVPPRYRPVVAGVGTAEPEWGSDSFGTTEPFTVLSPNGTATSSDVVVVSITGFEGYQGGLAQASAGYLAEERQELELDGRTAMYLPPTDAGGWADLVVAVGQDLAVRITSPSGSLDDLAAMLDRVEVPSDRRRAPVVSEPPAGLDVVGHMDADAVVSLEAFVAPYTDSVPGGTSAHGVGWVHDAQPEEQLAVLTLPGSSADLVAVPAAEAVTGLDDTWQRRTTSGTDVLVRERLDVPDTGWRSRSVWLESNWGDLVVVSASGTNPPSEEELIAVAASVRQAEDAEWAAFVETASGGPGLHPDPGRLELARGEADGLEWLLQTGPPGGAGLSGPEVDLASNHGVDPCLKLSNGRRACATSGGGGLDDWVVFGQDEGLSFVVISTTIDAASVRVTTAVGVAERPTVEIPGGGLWGTVVFVDAPAMPVCPDQAGPPPPTIDTMVVEVIGPDGAVLGCLGVGGLTSPTSP